MPFYFSSAKPPDETWLAVTKPEFEAICLDTGERSYSDAVLGREGALFVFPSLPDALDDLALAFAVIAPVEIYGDSLSAGWWRVGKRGVRLAGLQGYNLHAHSLSDIADFWSVLTDVCRTVGVIPGATPGVTAMRIAQALSPERFVSPGRHVQQWCHSAFSAGARHNRPGRYSGAWLYDIHSAYPYVMSGLLPFGRWRLSPKKAPWYIARIVFNYVADEEFSPVWVRGEDGRVYHPIDVKGATAVLTSTDIETLDRHGSLRIIKETDRIGFEQKALMKSAQDFLMGCQQTYPQYRKPFKVMRNAMFGKLVQRESNERYILKRIEDREAARASGRLYRQYNGYEFGLFQYEVESYGFNDTPVAAAITALVRSEVYEQVNQHSVCVRTDSILSDCERPDLDVNADDGSWQFVESGSAVVYGDEGYIINDSAHLDGVQSVETRVDRFLATTVEKPHFAFGDTATQLKQWNLQVGKKETVRLKSDRLLVYHSPLAQVIRAVVPPTFY